MDPQQLLDKVEALYPEYLSMLEKVCLIESPTDCKEGVDRVGKAFLDVAKHYGWQAEIFPQKKAGDFITITMNPDAEGSPVVFSGHMDTVHPIGKFPEPVVWQDEENIYGPGVMDCKGGIVAAALAMASLSETGFTSRPVRLLLQSDEETGSALSGKDTVRLLCEKAKGARAFINLEGAKEGTAVLFRKGILRFEFSVSGIARHSAVCTSGASAIAEAAHKILALENMKDENGLTCNCGVIRGGTMANSVPDACTFIADIRFATTEQAENARKTVHDLAETVFVKGCVTTVREISFRPAMERCERNDRLLSDINLAFDKAGIDRICARDCLSGSDAAYITLEGIPCVDDLGVTGNFIHSVKEYAVKKSLAHSAKQLAAIAVYL